MKSIAKTVGLVMLIMLFSRLLALGSNIIYMTVFGVNLNMDIYSYTINLPNIVFNSLGTALTTAVIPIFAGYIGTGQKERAFRFVNNITGISFVFTSLLALLGILAAPLILYMLPRFRTGGYDFALMSLRVMFPIMIFYALNYIFQGVLQSLGKFNMPAFVSIPSSLIIILYVILLAPTFGIKGLVIATFVGLASQALILIPPLLKTEFRFSLSFNLGEHDVREALKLIPPVLLATSAYQVNMLFNTTLSAGFKDAVAIMTSVQNLILYAVLAFIYSITAVIFPRFTMLAARNDMDGFKESLSKVLKSVIFFLIPAAAVFIIMSYQLLNLLYGWKRITDNNISLGSGIMSLYALGITGVGIKEVVDRAFYSLKDTKKPAINGIAIMAVNIASSLILVNITGVFGIPLAYSLSSITGAVVLLILIGRKIGNFGGKSLAASAVKVLISSIFMVIVIFPLNLLLKHYSSGFILLDKGIKLFLPVLAGSIAYFSATCIMKVEEALDILRKIREATGKLMKSKYHIIK